MAFAGELDVPVAADDDAPVAIADDDAAGVDGSDAAGGDEEALCESVVASGGGVDASDGEDVTATDDVGIDGAPLAVSGGEMVAGVSASAVTVEDVEAIVHAGEYRDMGGVAMFVSEEDKIAAGRHDQNMKRQPLNDPDRGGAAANPTAVGTAASTPIAPPPGAKRPRIINLPRPNPSAATPAIAVNAEPIDDASTSPPTAVFHSPAAGPSSENASQTDAVLASQRRLAEHIAKAAAKHAASKQNQKAARQRELELMKENKRIAQQKRDHELTSRG